MEQQMFYHGERTVLMDGDYAFVLCSANDRCELGFFREWKEDEYHCLSFHPEFAIEARYELPSRVITVFLNTISAVTGLRYVLIADLSTTERALFPFHSPSTMYYRFFNPDD